MRRSSSHTVLLFLITLTNYAWLLPSPIGLSIDSVNMRHIVKWSPLQARCSTAHLYSIQFQGEFELLNGSWEDAPECQRIPCTECDLTHDLGSDADYNIRVRGHCGRLVSPWATLSGPFNRRDTTLTVLEMSVTVMGSGLQVSFTELPHHAALNMSISIWKKGQQLQSPYMGDLGRATDLNSPQIITVNHNPLHIASLQEGAVYCIQASIHLYLKHSSNDLQCVTITSPGVSWVTHITVSVTVVLMAGLLLAVFWSLVHCNPEACQSYFSKEPLPSSLQIDCHMQRLVSHVEEELYEPIHMIIPFEPPQQTAELTEEASMNSSGEIRPMLPKTHF